MNPRPPAATRRTAERALASLKELDAQERVALADIERTLRQLTTAVKQMQNSKTKTADKHQAAVLAFIKG